jgi:hypothetical protein
MKIDRAEVERLAKIAARAERDQVAVRVDPGKLAKLCRLALEVMDAPVAAIDQYLGNELEGATGEEFYGQRVRLVRVGEK